jgi:hypothetical protein
MISQKKLRTVRVIATMLGVLFAYLITHTVDKNPSLTFQISMNVCFVISFLVIADMIVNYLTK